MQTQQTTTTVSHKVKAEKKRKRKAAPNKKNLRIQVLTKKNPKSPKSRAYQKFAVLMKMHDKTVGVFKAQEGKHSKLDIEKGWPATELRWALKLGLVKLLNTN